MSKAESFLYFGYGSNMPQARIKSRCPSAEFVGVGRLEGWALKWNKSSKDGSAKCNIEKVAGEVVYGAVYRILKAEEADLDRHEGVGTGQYKRQSLEIAMNGEEKGAQVYIGKKPWKGEAGELKPYDWYRDHVLNGARERGLPRDYIKKAIESVAVQPDANIKRGERERAIYAINAER